MAQIDYGSVDPLLLIDERRRHSEDRLASIATSLNHLQHSVANLHRRIEDMAPVDLGPLEAAVQELATNDATLTQAVTDASTELGELKATAEALQEQLNGGEPEDTAKVAAILAGIQNVGTHLTTLTGQLTAATEGAENDKPLETQEPAEETKEAGSGADQGTDAPATDQAEAIMRDTNGLPLYITSLSPAEINQSLWILSALPGPNEEKLYTFANDEAEGAPNGVDGSWQLYVGPLPALGSSAAQ